MDKITKYILAGMLALALMITSGCGTDAENKTSTPVRVNFGTTAKTAYLPTSVPAEVTNIKITVTAADMVTISESYSVTAGKPFTASFEVPSGQNRIFKVDALGSAGTALYRGQTSHTLTGVAVDIPVNLESVMQACNSKTNSGEDLPDEKTFDLGQNHGNFSFLFDTYSQEDQITILYEGKTLFDSGCVGTSKTVSINYSGSSSQLTVKVNPNCNGGTGTSWEYTVSCPVQ